jgi:ribonuclease P protein component
VFYAQTTAAPDERTRLGITVSRRIGSAVVRNRVKRLVRECFRRKLRPMLPAGAAVVVIARAGAGELGGAAVESELISAATTVVNRLRQ